MAIAACLHQSSDADLVWEVDACPSLNQINTDLIVSYSCSNDQSCVPLLSVQVIVYSKEAKVSHSHLILKIQGGSQFDEC
jgi:hypothetical protein